MKMDGSYQIHLLVMGQFQDGTMTIHTEPDGSLSGTLAATDQTSAFTNGVQDGEHFEINVRIRGADMDLKGTIDEKGILNAEARKEYLTVIVRGTREG